MLSKEAKKTTLSKLREKDIDISGYSIEEKVLILETLVPEGLHIFTGTSNRRLRYFRQDISGSIPSTKDHTADTSKIFKDKGITPAHLRMSGIDIEQRDEESLISGIEKVKLLTEIIKGAKLAHTIIKRDVEAISDHQLKTLLIYHLVDFGDNPFISQEDIDYYYNNWLKECYSNEEYIRFLSDNSEHYDKALILALKKLLPSELYKYVKANDDNTAKSEDSKEKEQDKSVS